MKTQELKYLRKKCLKNGKNSFNLLQKEIAIMKKIVNKNFKIGPSKFSSTL